MNYLGGQIDRESAEETPEVEEHSPDIVFQLPTQECHISISEIYDISGTKSILPRSPVPPTYQENLGPLRCTTPCRRLSTSRLVSRRVSTPRVEQPRKRRRPSAHRLGTGSRRYQDGTIPSTCGTYSHGQIRENALMVEREAGKGDLYGNIMQKDIRYNI